MIGIEKMQIESNQPVRQVSPDRIFDPSVKTEHLPGKKTDRLEIGSAYQKFIDQAVQQEEKDQPQAILEARRLLENGDLDTLESARLAAESIFRFGI